jgi:hypothetical protein
MTGIFCTQKIPFRTTEIFGTSSIANPCRKGGDSLYVDEALQSNDFVESRLLSRRLIFDRSRLAPEGKSKVFGLENCPSTSCEGNNFPFLKPAFPFLRPLTGWREKPQVVVHAPSVAVAGKSSCNPNKRRFSNDESNKSKSSIKRIKRMA